jgi:hypothetical protein
MSAERPFGWWWAGLPAPAVPAPKPLPCTRCGRKPRAMGGRDLHCVDCAALVALEEATL